MADFTEMIISGAQKSVSESGKGLAENFMQGAELALKAEQVQQNKMKLKQDAEALQNVKLDKFNDALMKTENWKDPRAKANYIKNYLPKIRDQYGLQDVVPDEMIANFASNEEYRARAYTVMTMMQNEELTREEGYRILGDDAALSQIQPTAPELRGDDKLSVDAALARAQDAQAKRSQMQQSASQFQQGQSATATRDQLDRREKLEKKIADTGLIDMMSDISTLEAGIPGGIKGWKGGDIPGLSGSTAKLPLSELSGAAAANRQAAQRMFNLQLKKMSGQSVMNQEMARAMDAFGMSSTYKNGEWAPVENILVGLKKPTSPDKVIQGIRYLQRSAMNEERRLKNTYGEDTYRQVTQGVETGSLAPKSSGKQAAPPSGAENAAGKIDAAVNVIKAKFPDPAKVTPAVVQAIKQKLAARGLSEQEIVQVMQKLGGQ